MPRQPLALVPVLVLLAAGCAVNLPVSHAKIGTTVTASASTFPVPTASSATGGRPTPILPAASPLALPTPVPSGAAQFFGRVLGIDGKPAAGVAIRGYLISDLSSGMLTENGAGILANNGGGIVAPGAGLHLMSTDLAAVTDADGYFPPLVDPKGGEVNIEAVKQTDVKAITLGIKPDASGIVLQLARTGSVTGRVAAKAGKVSDLLGVDVFVPGTSYVAKTDAAGNYTISNVPVGRFTLVATKTGLGSASVDGVAVASDQTATAPELDLVAVLPSVKQVSQTDVGPGASVTVTGDNFGAKDGSPFGVALGGVPAVDAVRVDDHTITFSVPESATSGDLVVTVAQLASNATPMRVFKALLAPPELAALHAGDRRTLTALGKDSAGAYASVGGVTWSATGAVSILANGTLVAGQAGTGTLTGKNGKLTVTVPISVNDPTTPIVTTLCGQERAFGEGFGDVDGPTTVARFSTVAGLAVDPDGTVYLTQSDTNTIRKVTPNGVVTTLAGNGHNGYADGLGNAAGFNAPIGIVLMNDGTLLVADAANYRLRKVTKDGLVSTFGGDGLAEDRDGALAQARFNNPASLWKDAAGNVFVDESMGYCIRKLTPDGQVSTVLKKDAIAPSDVSLLTGDTAGNLYLADPKAHTIWRVTPAGAARPLASDFTAPVSAAVGSDGNLYVLDVLKWWDEGGATSRLCVVTPDGQVTAIAPSRGGYADGPLATAGFSRPLHLTALPDGSVLGLDGDESNYILRRFSGLP